MRPMKFLAAAVVSLVAAVAPVSAQDKPVTL
jgi:hypothetical protein